MSTETSTATSTVNAPTQVFTAPSMVGRDATNDFKNLQTMKVATNSPAMYMGGPSTKALARRKAKHDAKFDSNWNPWGGRHVGIGR